MNKPKESTGGDISELAEDARALMAATADVAGEKVSEARKRLAAALERGKEIAGDVRDQAVKSAKVVDQKVRENPYQVLVIGVIAGVLIGYFAARRCSRNDD